MELPETSICGHPWVLYLTPTTQQDILKADIGILCGTSLFLYGPGLVLQTKTTKEESVYCGASEGAWSNCGGP